MVAAYLQALLEHDVYITDINEEEYWKLDKALYALKQAGHEWFKTLCNILSMHQCIGDEGTYTSRNYQLFIDTHVNDLIGIAPTENDLDNAENPVERRVELGKRGKPTNMLGVELHWSDRKVVLIQTRLKDSMTTQFLAGEDGGKHSRPLNADDYKSPENPPNETHPKFQAIVGGLLFIARMTRPDISIHANLLGRRTKDATPTHYYTALKVLRYLREEGLILRKAENLSLHIYTDAAYGGEAATSQTGSMMYLGQQLVGWYSQRQDVVSLSVTEAEHIGNCEGAKDAAWSHQFLKELNIHQKPTDREGFYHLGKTQKFSRKSRHIEHRYHYVRQQVRQENLPW